MGNEVTLPDMAKPTTSLGEIYNTQFGWDLFFMGGECATSINFFQRINAWFVGYNKFICPFGIVVAGTASYPDAYMYQAANIVAEIIDQNQDGIVDNEALRESMKNYMLGGGTD